MAASYLYWQGGVLVACPWALCCSTYPDVAYSKNVGWVVMREHRVTHPTFLNTG